MFSNSLGGRKHRHFKCRDMLCQTRAEQTCWHIYQTWYFYLQCTF